MDCEERASRRSFAIYVKSLSSVSRHGRQKINTLRGFTFEIHSFSPESVRLLPQSLVKMSVIFNGTIKRKANGVKKIKRKALNDWEERRFNQIRRLPGG